MVLVIELGPHTRQMLREIVGVSKDETKEIVKEVLKAYAGSNGDTPEAARARHGPARSGKETPAAPLQTAKTAMGEEAALLRLREKAAAEAEATAEGKPEQPPLCECGCGRRVTKRGNRFIHGHGGGRSRKKQPKPSLKLTPQYLAAVKDMVTCPKTGDRENIDECTNCNSCVTRLKDPVTGLRYVRCVKADVQRKEV